MNLLSSETLAREFAMVRLAHPRKQAVYTDLCDLQSRDSTSLVDSKPSRAPELVMDLGY